MTPPKIKHHEKSKIKNSFITLVSDCSSPLETFNKDSVNNHHKIKEGKVYDVSRKNRSKDSSPKKVKHRKYSRESSSTKKSAKKTKSTNEKNTKLMNNFLESGKLYSFPKKNKERKDDAIIELDSSTSDALKLKTTDENKVKSVNNLLESKKLYSSPQRNNEKEDIIINLDSSISSPSVSLKSHKPTGFGSSTTCSITLNEFNSKIPYNHQLKEGKVFDSSKHKVEKKSRKGKEKSKEKNKTKKNSPNIDKYLSKKSTNKNRKFSDDDEDHENQSKKPKFTRSNSFEKYGVLLPTVEDIIKNQIEKKKEAEALASFKNSNKNCQKFVPKSLSSLIPAYGDKELLDCKHLNEIEMKSYFMENLTYINDISCGNIYSDRHLLYKNEEKKSELITNNSTLVFTQDQIDYLLQLLQHYIDVENTEYFLMVLIPELCLKIFMNTHKMEKQEAIDYLEWRPCD